MVNFTDESLKSLLIKMYFNEKHLSSGTGFLIRSNSGPVLITNRHNVTGRHNETGECLSKTKAVPNRIAISHHKKGELGSVTVKSEELYQNEEPLWIEHPDLGSKVDLVALKLTNLKDVEIHAYSLDAGSHMDISGYLILSA